jgi:hypothetical protein
MAINGREGREMPNENNKHAGLKEKAIAEFKVFWLVTLFLAFLFCAFTLYRRLILTEVGVSYFHYGAGLIEAMIIAKIILIGQAFGLGKRFEHGPLIMATLFKAVLYGVFVAAFAILEHLIGGMVQRKNLTTAWQELLGLGKDEIFARTLMVIVTFVPFFAFWETARVLGEGKLFELFFQRKA